MSAPPYMRLYWADYHQDTRHLTRDEHGAYFLLLGEAWNRGGFLPADDAILARWALATPDEWARLGPVVMGFFRSASKGRWRHKRISEELAAYDEVSRKRKLAGKRGGSTKHGKDEENGEAIAKHKPTKPEPEPEPEPEEERVRALPVAELALDPPQRRVAATTRGSRLTGTWIPSNSDLQFAFDEGFSPAEAGRISDAFRDYWTAQAGAKGVKLDWSSTWKNWVRREHDRRQPRTVAARRQEWV